MLYINSPDLKANALTYSDLVELTIKAGIAPKRAYIYLAGLGVRGELTRIMGDNHDYGRPIKMAVYGDTPTFVTSAEVCAKCGQLSINFV